MRALLAGCFVISLATHAAAQEDVLMRAMKDELARSMKKLQLENLDKPYFIAYRIDEHVGKSVSATFGSLVNRDESRFRYLNVEVRVGDYKFDDTNFLTLPFGPSGVTRMFDGTVAFPLEDDYREVQRQLWLATDAAYKKALDDFSKKRAALQNRTQSEELADFSKMDPTTTNDQRPPLNLSLDAMGALARELSGLFREMPQVSDSDVQLHAFQRITRYANSEGTTYTISTPSVSLNVRAESEAPDGTPLNDSFAAYGAALEDLPAKSVLVAQVRDLGVRLKSLQAAPVAESYNGPVLFEGQAAAELFAEVLAPKLLARRTPVSDNRQFAAQIERMSANPLADRLGARVLPSFLSVSDNPTTDHYSDAKLPAHPKVDDDGIACAETKLIENGILKRLLTTRTPVHGIPASSGSRHGSDAMPTNLFMTASESVDSAQLRAKLLELAKQRGRDYGVVVRRIPNPLAGGGRTGAMAAMRSLMMPGEVQVGDAVAYKVFADGHEELMRNAEITGMSLASFKDIVAASKEQTVYTAPFFAMGSSPFMGMSFGMSGQLGMPVGFVVPSLLFDEAGIKKPTEEIPKPPLSKNPYFEK